MIVNRTKYREEVFTGGPDECWPWRGATRGGYGVMSCQKDSGEFTTIGSHVFAFFLKTGRMPKLGMKVCHTCDNPPCCNPNHLFEGTHQENIEDMRVKGRRLGKNNGEIHGLAKLTAEIVLEMRRLYYAEGVQQKVLARRYGVHPTTARNAILGITWDHL